ncbi:hypothetical protein MBOU_24930 [Mycobacterium bourgelatii]|uniref:Uncharacterized protein n=1 Tax=Mycobacterium bourgelatii TaxID=1273442 RepID=A0A7I9YP46_MYCBU|nr:hypothetical protein MBOU_24930 [Mycobacterium bourgelatii]
MLSARFENRYARAARRQEMDATDFADNALEAWQHLTLPCVSGVSPSALVIFEAFNAVAKASTAVVMDWADTPDV